ncbi:hypothetical protein ACA910_003125 [Epithemia clementina (nom. ined.)]
MIQRNGDGNDKRNPVDPLTKTKYGITTAVKVRINKSTRTSFNSTNATFTATSAPSLIFTTIAGAVLSVALVGAVHPELVDRLIQSLLSPSSSYSSLGPEWNLPTTRKPSSSKEHQKSTASWLLQQGLNHLEIAIRGSSGKSNNGGTRIVNAFVQNQTLLRLLAEDSLWQECYNAPVRWIPLKTISTNNDANGQDVVPSEPQIDAAPYSVHNIWEDLAFQIWKDQPEMMVMSSTRVQRQLATGLEYWCNILTPNTPLQWHVDKDEVLYERPQHHSLRTPTMGAVYYGYPHSLRGGYLEILNYGALVAAPDEAGREIERIRPEYNRLVYLNVSNWHSVSPLYIGSRYTFAVNVWHGPPPLAFQQTHNTASQ